MTQNIVLHKRHDILTFIIEVSSPSSFAKHIVYVQCPLYNDEKYSFKNKLTNIIK